MRQAEVREERARGNLRQRLLKLRQDAGDIVADEAGTLSLTAAVSVDPPDPPSATLLQALEFDDCAGSSRWLDGKREAERERRKREWLAEVREAVSQGQGQRRG
jgi:DNA-binding SARP family transcriptional activator